MISDKAGRFFFGYFLSLKFEGVCTTSPLIVIFKTVEMMTFCFITSKPLFCINNGDRHLCYGDIGKIHFDRKSLKIFDVLRVLIFFL